MKELFGLPTVHLMFGLLVLLGVALLTVGYIAVTNRTMFRMGVRNLPRRGLQTGLVVAGLSLATLITTAAFITGDTVDHSLTADTYKFLGRSDIDISWVGERPFDSDAGAATEGSPAYANGNVVDDLEATFADDPDIEGFLPFLHHQAPATNEQNGISVPAIIVTGVDAERLDLVGGLQLAGGGQFTVSSLKPGEILLSQRAADDLDASRGDIITLYIHGSEHTFTVAGVVRNELASGVLGYSYSTAPGGAVLPLAEVQALLGLQNNQISSLTVVLKGGVRGSLENAEAAAARVQSAVGAGGVEFFGAGAGIDSGRQVEVFATKANLIEESQATGNLFTSIFLVLGLFSMAAGVMLIFMIFVMLAAERKSEMGMSRAVGAQRGHLVQSFIAEGMAYSLLAGIIGVFAGVGASFLLTEVLLGTFGGEYFSLIEFKLTPVSLVIGYCLGVVITFLTVIFASMKVSHVNIISAIRQLPEQTKREQKRKTRWGWVIAGIPALAIPPLGLWWTFRKGFGLPKAWLVAPGSLALAAVCILLGKSSEMLFLFSLGVSLVPLSLASLAAYYRAPARGLWTVVGFVLAAYWLMPSSLHARLFGEFSSDMEMFVLAGIMVVVALTLIVVFNAGLLTRLFSKAGDGIQGYAVAGLMGLLAIGAVAVGMAMGDSAAGFGQLSYLLAGLLAPVAILAWVAARFPQFGPALKMGIAYPLANRFRTGMTVAMFSLIVFSLTVFSVLLANFDTAFLGGNATGNLDIVASASGSQPVDDLGEALDEAGSDAAGSVESIGSTTVATGSTTVYQVGSDQEGPEPYPVLAADDGFLGDLAPGLSSYAIGYGSEAEVLAAVASDPTLALVDGTVVGSGFNGSYDWGASGVTVEDRQFTAFQLELFDTASGESTIVTVVGVLQVALPSTTIAGIYLNEAGYEGTFGPARYHRFYLRTVEGANNREAARDIQSALATQGVSADSIRKLLDDDSAQDQTFNRMFQAFMALGLLVGIAGLGVIAFRSVVERRQQIGMLRAIGYQRGTVTLTFLLESSFVAAFGILSGVVGGAILGWNLLNSPAFTDGASIQFAMPWAEVITIVIASFSFALLMTWWPSRGASRVPVAEALRYE